MSKHNGWKEKRTEGKRRKERKHWVTIYPLLILNSFKKWYSVSKRIFSLFLLESWKVYRRSETISTIKGISAVRRSCKKSERKRVSHDFTCFRPKLSSRFSITLNQFYVIQRRSQGLGLYVILSGIKMIPKYCTAHLYCARFSHH